MENNDPHQAVGITYLDDLTPKNLAGSRLKSNLFASNSGPKPGKHKLF